MLVRYLNGQTVRLYDPRDISARRETRESSWKVSGHNTSGKRTISFSTKTGDIAVKLHTVQTIKKKTNRTQTAIYIYIYIYLYKYLKTNCVAK